MKVITRLEIILDADETVMDGLKHDVNRLLRDISDLYESYGVFNVEVKPLSFDKKTLEWRDVTDEHV